MNHASYFNFQMREREREKVRLNSGSVIFIKIYFNVTELSKREEKKEAVDFLFHFLFYDVNLLFINWRG